MESWNADLYQQFISERTRGARDLLAAIPTYFQPNLIYDLGCGPGNSTTLLKQRWPEARVVGIDSSASMLKKARMLYPHIEFLQMDLTQLTSAEKVDLIFANAVLQWVDHHALIFPQLIDLLNAKGFFAAQMPNNFHGIAHQSAITLLNTHTKWKPWLAKLRYGTLNAPYFRMEDYYQLLTNAQLSHLDLWETEYCQEFLSYEAIFDWMQGTAFNPFLPHLDPENVEEFRRAYLKLLASSYPLEATGKVLFPYRRLFMVGSKSEGT